MSSPDTTREYGENELPEDEDIETEIMSIDETLKVLERKGHVPPLNSAAYHWSKIKELTQEIEMQVKDLQILLKEFGKGI